MREMSRRGHTRCKNITKPARHNRLTQYTDCIWWRGSGGHPAYSLPPGGAFLLIGVENDYSSSLSVFFFERDREQVEKNIKIEKKLWKPLRVTWDDNEFLFQCSRCGPSGMTTDALYLSIRQKSVRKGVKRVVQLIGETPLFCGTIWGPFPFWGGCITCSTAITARRDTTNHQLITDMYICRCCERWTSLPHKRSFHQHGQLVCIWMSRSECAAAVCGDMRFRFRVYTPFAEPASACCGFSLSLCVLK